jgi:hypothetical protein
MLTFGKFAVDTGRFDTDVPRTAFDVLADMGTDLKLKPGQYLFGRPNIWPLISRMYEGYIEGPRAGQDRQTALARHGDATRQQGLLRPLPSGVTL